MFAANTMLGFSRSYFLNMVLFRGGFVVVVVALHCNFFSRNIDNMYSRNIVPCTYIQIQKQKIHLLQVFCCCCYIFIEGSDLTDQLLLPPQCNCIFSHILRQSFLSETCSLYCLYNRCTYRSTRTESFSPYITKVYKEVYIILDFPHGYEDI